MRDLAALEQVAAQAGGLVGGPAQLVEDRDQLAERARVTIELDQRDTCAMVGGVGGARRAIQLLGPLGIAERDREVGGIGQPPRAFRGEAGTLGDPVQQIGRRAELAAVAQQDREPVDRRHELRVVGQRALEQLLRLVELVRDLGGAGVHACALGAGSAHGGEPLQHRERPALRQSDRDREPGQRVEHVVATRLQPIGFLVGVERAARVVELALVDLADLAKQLGALAIDNDVHGPAAQQIDQHRPLGVGPVEQLERLVGVRVGGRQQQHALEAVRGVVAATQLLPRRRDLAEAPGACIVRDVDHRDHGLERQLVPALGQAREPEQRIEIGGDRDLAERGELHDQRPLGIAALLEVRGQLAQDLGALRALLGGLGALEVEVDDPVALGIERGGRGPGDAALHRTAQARGVELGELLEQRPRQQVHRQRVWGLAAHREIIPLAVGQRDPEPGVAAIDGLVSRGASWCSRERCRSPVLTRSPCCHSCAGAGSTPRAS